MTSIRLSCGRELQMKGFHLQDAAMFLHCKGVVILFGSPERWRKEIVEKGPSRLNKMWWWVGDLPTVFLDDADLDEGADGEHDEFDQRRHLPGSVVHVWLRSKGIAADADGADLVVSFFHDSLDGSISEIVERRLHKLDWATHAKDWRYEEVYPWFYGVTLEEEDENADPHGGGG